MIRELIEKNRSYRRFDGNYKISKADLRNLVDLARLSPTAANLQPYKFIISSEKKVNDKIFPFLSWAGYLDDWNGPEENERPTGYIIVTGDTTISKNFGYGAGICCQSILLGAVEMGLGGCLVGAIERKNLQKKLNLPEELEILLVIALGKPVEKVMLEDVEPDASLEYYRDDQNVHHVPKRKLDDIIIPLD